ncbi:Metallo-dependent phosphatase-like protein [Pelagophyceae sp. CCMP2097]|nr:Metallo-dependent phosphatase-like protein [Pelagophyceae sp. CCMP2097]
MIWHVLAVFFSVLVLGVLGSLPLGLHHPFIRRLQRLSPSLFWFYVEWLWCPFTDVRAMCIKLRLRHALRSRVVYVEACGRCSVVAAPPPKRPGALRVMAISDTHNEHAALGLLQDADVLVHCGDLLIADRDGRGEAALKRVSAWLASQPHRHKLFVGGNHDGTLEKLGASEIKAIFGDGARYCLNEAVDIDGVRFFLSPYSRSNGKVSRNRAFQSPMVLDGLHAALASKDCKAIDVLVTHGPARGALDYGGSGSKDLVGVVRRLRPAFHVFGHEHNAFGSAWDAETGTTFLNASILDGQFAPVKPPIVFDVVPPDLRPPRRGQSFVSAVSTDIFKAQMTAATTMLDRSILGDHGDDDFPPTFRRRVERRLSTDSLPTFRR